MTREEFKNAVSRRIIFSDGATGTELIKRGMPQGVSPEVWVIEHPEIISEIQQAYFRAGSDIIYVPSFGGNPLKLAEFDLAESCFEINRKLAEISRKNLPDKVWCFGDISPSGQFVEPFGDLPFEEAVENYRQQIRGLIDGGVDGLVIETMLDLQECRAAVIAARELCNLPIMLTMTFDESGRSLTGNDPLSCLITLQSLGVDAFGCNCSTGPEEMVKLIAAIKPYATIPLIAKPNAGLPDFIDGRTIFNLKAEQFGRCAAGLVAAGVNIMGGCCGTTPEHIASLVANGRDLQPIPPQRRAISALASPRGSYIITPDSAGIIGERINPTGKKQLQAELREQSLESVKRLAREQEERGAVILDLNFGSGGIDEKLMMRKAICALSGSCNLPFSIDTTNPEVLEEALRLCPGRALVNSISGERERLQVNLKIAAKYGAMIIILPLDDQGIPEETAGRRKIARQVYDAALAAGLNREDLVLDILVMSVATGSENALRALEMVEFGAHELKVNTTCGLSNISFGMPEREKINGAFLTMALARGMNLAIANVGSEYLMTALAASGALTGGMSGIKRYIDKFSAHAAVPGGETSQLPPEKMVYNGILCGDAQLTVKSIALALKAGLSAKSLVDDYLIQAINQVGELYDKKKYFLPQLMQTAEAMSAGFNYLEPVLRENSSSEIKKPKVVIATVQGDIHDIGKNIAGLMLKNYGFEVIDLGKDVPAERIVEALRIYDARILGLSALMTTTMVRLPEVIEAVRAAGLDKVKIMVAGAVVDQAYADLIGADGYAADAMAGVVLAKEFAKNV